MQGSPSVPLTTHLGHYAQDFTDERTTKRLISKKKEMFTVINNFMEKTVHMFLACKNNSIQCVDIHS